MYPLIALAGVVIWVIAYSLGKQAGQMEAWHQYIIESSEDRVNKLLEETKSWSDE